MLIYISGKITGLDIEVAKQNFKHAENELILQGFTVINPMELVPYDPKLTWDDYMVEDIKALFRCNAIFMLRNWSDSKGARIERAIAVEMEQQIIYQK
jgi:hypothetical protein